MFWSPNSSSTVSAYVKDMDDYKAQDEGDDYCSDLLCFGMTLRAQRQRREWNMTRLTGSMITRSNNWVFFLHKLLAMQSYLRVPVMGTEKQGV